MQWLSVKSDEQYAVVYCERVDPVVYITTDIILLFI
jgi:hypothetical protein